jgi:predicted DNA-binding transcriptional regulator AlpA
VSVMGCTGLPNDAWSVCCIIPKSGQPGTDESCRRGVERWRRLELEDGWAGRATAAQMLGVSVRTLLRWHREGKGPPRRHTGNGIRYRISEIDDWLRRNSRS